MADEDIEYTESGAPILRHKLRDRGFELNMGHDDESYERIVEHIQRFIGNPATVFHEYISDLIHVDIHRVDPTKERNYYTLITTGMSDKPMAVPPSFRNQRYVELLICLPPSWRLSQEDFGDERNYWPLRVLKFLSRLPHEFETWLWAEHTVPNGNPMEPFALNTEFCCTILDAPALVNEEFVRLIVNEEKSIYFLSLIPIYKEEMEFKLKHGADALFDRLYKAGVTELLDIDRPNTCI